MITKAIQFIGFLLVTQLMACATIVDGKTQLVNFTSVPEGAEVLVNGVNIGLTPLSYELLRSEATIITVRKEGYATVERTLETEMNPMFWGNIIFGGVLGSTTDSSTGASIEYRPGQFLFNLEGEG